MRKRVHITLAFVVVALIITLVGLNVISVKAATLDELSTVTSEKPGTIISVREISSGDAFISKDSKTINLEVTIVGEIDPDPTYVYTKDYKGVTYSGTLKLRSYNNRNGYTYATYRGEIYPQN